MAVSEADLAEMEKMLTAEDTGTPVFPALRQRFPQLSWTQCDASDVTEAPYRTFPKFEMFLLDTTDHCAVITDDPSRASGIILGKRSGM